MKYDHSEVLERVNGLNSHSTLKRWQKRAEELTGVSFYEEVVRTGKRSAVRITLYSEEDIQKFQQIADTMKELGFDQAVLQAFSGDCESPKPINERVELMMLELMDLDKETKSKFHHLYQENKRLNSLINSFEKRIAQLEEQPKRKGLFR